jgi:hypothetical protein
MAFQPVLPALRSSTATTTSVALPLALRPSVSLQPLTATSHFASATRRLVVLIPDVDTNEPELARYIWQLASTRELSVLLLGTFEDVRREPRARRRLATLASLMCDDRVQVETRLEAGQGWWLAIQTVLTNGDLVVCHAEQQVARLGVGREPLSRWLMARLNQPVCELAGFYPELPPELPGPVNQIITIGVPIFIIAAFTLLEVLIHQMVAANFYIPAMALAVVVEYGLVGAWYFLLN